MSRKNRTPSTTNDCRPDADRRGVTTWVYICATAVGLWVLAPLITRLISLAVGDSVTLTLSRPDELSGPAGTELLGLTTTVPVDQLGSAATTGVVVGTVLELIAVLVMLAAVTVVMRSLRPGRELGNRTKVVAIIVVLVAGIIGLIGANVLTGAGVSAWSDACIEEYESVCGVDCGGGGWTQECVDLVEPLCGATCGEIPDALCDSACSGAGVVSDPACVGCCSHSPCASGEPLAAR